MSDADSAPVFQWFRLQAPERDWRAAQERLAAALPHITNAGLTVWGSWFGAFGLKSNELIYMLVGDADATMAALPIFARAGVKVDTHLVLAPTARPVGLNPPPAGGILVFRFFDVRHSDAEQIAALSAAAWRTFEGTDNYDAQAQGLWREHNPQTATGVMMLLTRYDSFASWETSRAPPAEARTNFMRRAELTAGTVAYAVRPTP